MRAPRVLNQCGLYFGSFPVFEKLTVKYVLDVVHYGLETVLQATILECLKDYKYVELLCILWQVTLPLRTGKWTFQHLTEKCVSLDGGKSHTALNANTSDRAFVTRGVMRSRG